MSSGGTEPREHVLVTGGSSGIGAGIVRRSIADGYAVVVLDRVPPREIGPVTFVETDLADIAAIRQAIPEAITGRRIGRLVNNVGTAIPARMKDFSPDDLRRMMDLNLVTTVELIRALAPTM